MWVVTVAVLVLAVIHAVVGLVNICLGVTSSIQAEVWLAHSVSPIWSGGFFIFTGIMGFACAKRKTAYMIMCFTAFSIVSMVVAIVSIQLLRLGLVNHTTDGQTFQKENKDVLILVALGVAGFECLLCVISSFVSCRLAKEAKKELQRKKPEDEDQCFDADHYGFFGFPVNAEQVHDNTGCPHPDYHETPLNVHHLGHAYVLEGGDEQEEQRMYQEMSLPPLPTDRYLIQQESRLAGSEMSRSRPQGVMAGVHGSQTHTSSKYLASDEGEEDETSNSVEDSYSEADDSPSEGDAASANDVTRQSQRRRGVGTDAGAMETDPDAQPDRPPANIFLINTRKHLYLNRTDSSDSRKSRCSLDSTAAEMPDVNQPRVERILNIIDIEKAKNTLSTA